MSDDAWLSANQRFLSTALAVVRARLSTADEPGEASKASAPREDSLRAALAARDAAERAMPSPSALQVLSDAFGLSPFEREVVLLCAGSELDSAMTPLLKRLNGDGAPTFALALARLAGAHWSALLPESPLRRHELIELGGESPTRAPLRVDEHTLHFLTGSRSADPRLSSLLKQVHAPPQLPPSHAATASELAALLSRQVALVHLCGPDSAAWQDVAASACATLHRPLFMLRAVDLPSPGPDRERVLVRWERMALLLRAVLLVCTDEAVEIGSALGDRLAGPVLLGGREPPPGGERPAVRIQVPRLPAGERLVLWRERLSGPLPADALERLAEQFPFGAAEIGAIAAAAAPAPGDADPLRPVWDVCRALSRPNLGELAERIEPAASWDDLVLPVAQRALLDEIALHVRKRGQVYQRWGFASKLGRGLGVSALFAGPSGTGKTLAAEVLAGVLRLDLYRIDLSQVVSKYVGDTEKNLRRIFDAAELSGAILLFDEADALFGKRSEVRDSHDRYANVEIGYLLQRMEAYQGLAVLTTNMRGSLDAAFLRRIRFIVSFPMPGPEERLTLWRRAFPLQTPVVGLAAEELAALELAGGSIMNIALRATFLASDTGGPVHMGHVVKALRGELQKLDWPPPRAEMDALEQLAAQAGE